MKKIQITVTDIEFNPDYFEDVAENIARQFPDVIGFGFQNGSAELSLEIPIERLPDILKQTEAFEYANFTLVGFQDDNGDITELIPLHSATVVVDRLKDSLITS